MVDKPYRILFLTPAFPPFPGGGERYAGSLAEYLVAQGHQVTVLTSLATSEVELWSGSSGKKVISKVENGIRVIRCPIAGIPGKWTGLTAWRKAMVLTSSLPGDQSPILFSMARYIPSIVGLEEELDALAPNIDLIHGFNISWEYPMATGWRLAQQQNLPLFISPFAHLGSGKGDRVARNSTMDHQLRILMDAQRIFALTQVEKDGLVEYGLQQERIEVVGVGLEPIPSFSAPDEVLAEFGLTKPFALFIGRINKDKGAIDAAEAIIRLRAQGSDICLVLVGRVTKEFDLSYQGLTAEDKQIIRPIGMISEAKKHGLLSACKVLLLPSRSDSFGIVLLEAWAHGKPVIGARAGGIPGVIRDGKTGFLVDYGDVSTLAGRINQLLLNDELSVSMGKAGMLLTESEYTWERVTKRVFDSYQRFLVQ